PCVDVWDQQSLVYTTAHPGADEVLWNADEGFFFHKINRALCGDFVIVVRFGGGDDDDNAAAGLPPYSDTRVLLRYANCAGFVLPGVPLRLSLDEIDVSARYADGFDGGFCMTAVFDTVDGSAIQDDQYFSDALEPLLRGAAAARQGLLDIASFHVLTANMRRLDKLLAMGYPPEAATLGLQLTGNDSARAVQLIEEGLGAKLSTKTQFSPMSGSDVSVSPVS
ncbi:hypothetical protein JKP88DRAFT_136365, partial [Tribonema minus]